MMTSNDIDPETLPPKKQATYFHSMHVYFRLQQWETLNLECLNPKEWIWKQKVNMLQLIKTTTDPVPAMLLKVA